MSGISTITKIRYNPRGTYASNVRYGIDDMVFYLGSYYRCVVEGTLGTTPTIYDTDNSPWQKMSQTPYHQGEWSSSTTYFAGDVVGVTTTMMYDRIYNYQDYDTYICLNNTGVSGNTNYPPTDPADWKLLSRGNFNKKRAFLSNINEGYVAGYRRLWDARCAASPGSIGIVSVTAGGSGYTTTYGYPAGLSTATVTITNGTGGTGVGASAVAYVSAAGTIFAIEITNPGYGYTSAPLITITGGGGNGATATVYSYQDKVGMGDTFGRFKNSGHTGNGFHVRYINKRYGLMNAGYQDSTYNTFGWSSNVTTNAQHSESSFIHNEWYEGLLPTPDGLPPKIIQVEASSGETLVLFNNGEVHYAGYNGHGQSGDATTTVNTQFVRCGYANTNKSGNSVLRGKKAIRIASTAGAEFTNSACANYALIENPGGSRELWAWGYNGYGQLADGTTTNQSIPVKINLPEATHGKIIEIWATGGQYGNLWVLTDTGRLFSAGYNGYGQLGDGTSTSKSVLTRVGIGSTNFTWTGPLHRIKKFICGPGGTGLQYSLLTDRGTLWQWGFHYANAHDHTYNVYYPIQVNTGGYSGVSADRTYATGAGTTVGVAFTNVCDVWTTSGASVAGNTYVSVGSTALNPAPGITTFLGQGPNNVYQLSLAINDSTNRYGSKFLGIQTSNGYIARDVVDVNACNTSSSYHYASGPLRMQHQNGTLWYTLPWTNGRGATGETGGYNVERFIDPDFIDTNYRIKPIYLWPRPFDQAYIKVYWQMGGGYTSGGIIMVNLKDGRMHLSTIEANQTISENNNTYASGWARVQNH